MTTHLEQYRAANAPLTDVVEAVNDWTAESPCAGWTVRDVLDHLIDTERDFLDQHGIDIGPRPSTEADPASAWKEHSTRVQEVLETPDLAEKSFDGFFGPATVGATLATFYGFDLLVHRWDIARGAGQQTHFGDTELDLIEESLNGFGEHLYMEGICKPALPVSEDASRESRLLARMGRDAAWRSGVNA
ncbi:maleylpyruvate isomerase family mycothiol-dependent enzyme [Arthrobacter sp. JZ12]|uniref:maleylpyruvate isomerase family mycothiol-dependent enzyme n=1 Tax=Arthrobacter sp. JZ12 TaxID=2654190 RepID=UPI002B4A8AFB|nr:maleylpyruvate isomerase family mycothiol-dependent enzyme [Arthrobacter sp. JZ12]WRH25541.1 maleylpyruvate isomerase family mycothiol-dependent enzyme [Arthrobacter sp. JZ12]